MAHPYNEELQIGDRIAGRYEILAIVGQGSMGVVYKCRHDILGRLVAIKTLRLREAVSDDRSQKRFEREARLASRLDHPNLISVHDFGHTASGDPYLVMDFVSGQPLFDIMKRERYLIPERAVHLFSQVCDGLFHAHQRGVIHRDLKPANILVVRNENGPETVKIVDLGVAKIVQGDDEENEAITRTGEVCGSPIYLSPEQCMYQELDPRTDIYSLGVCLYEALMGQPPLRGATVYDTIYMHVHELPKPFSAIPGGNPDVPRRLEEVTFRCLAKQPNDRFETMMQLKQELLASLKPQHETSSSSVKVLPPEQLFGGGASARTKSSGETPMPGRNQSGESRPDLQDSSSRSNMRRPTEEFSGLSQPGTNEPEKAGRKSLSGAARARSTEDESEPANQQQAGRPGKDARSSQQNTRAEGRGTGQRTASGKTPAYRDGAASGSLTGGRRSRQGAIEEIGLKKMLILAVCVSVIFGLSVGLGFAYFLTATHQNQVATNTPTPGPALPALPGAIPGPPEKTPGSSTPTQPDRVFSTEPPATTVKPVNPPTQPFQHSSAQVTGKAGKQPHNSAAGKKPKASGIVPSSDLSRYLPDDTKIAGAQGSQSKYFSIVNNANSYRNPGRGMQRLPMRMPMQQRVPANMSPMRSGQALDKLKNNPFIERIKEFAASQGMPIPGVQPPNQSGQQGSGLLPQGNNSFMPMNNSQNDQERAVSLCNEGTKLCQTKQYASACQKFGEAYKLDPQNSQVKGMYAWALNARALELNNAQQYGDAVAYETKAVNLNPAKALYHNNLHNFSQNLDAQRAGTLP